MFINTHTGLPNIFIVIIMIIIIFWNIINYLKTIVYNHQELENIKLLEIKDYKKNWYAFMIVSLRII